MVQRFAASSHNAVAREQIKSRGSVMRLCWRRSRSPCSRRRQTFPPGALFDRLRRSREKLSQAKSLQATSGLTSRACCSLRKGTNSHALLPKTRRPLNVIHGSARFAKFNRPRGNSRSAVKREFSDLTRLKEDTLEAENSVLRELLDQAGLDASRLLAQAGINATEKEAAERLQRLLLEELHHRVKNTLATVMAIASQSLRNATDLEQGREAIAHRLIALGRAHDLLLQTNWTSASLPEIVRAAVEPFDTPGTERFVVRGVEMDVGPAAVLSLAMPAILAGRPIRPDEGTLRRLALHDLPEPEQYELVPTFGAESGQAFRTMLLGSARIPGRQFQGPVLCLSGSEDRVISNRIPKVIARYYSARHETFAKRGHWLIASSAQDGIVTTIVRWLEKHVINA
jgi:HWE histidine kinase